MNLFISAQDSAQLNLYQQIRDEQRLTGVSSTIEPFDERRRRPITEVNVRQLAKTTGQSYTSVYHTYTKLLATLKQINPAAKNTAALFALPVGQLRMHIISTTPGYYFLQAAMCENIHSFDEFEQKYGIPKSTLTRHLTGLKTLATASSVHIRVSRFELEGDEPHIRLFLMAAFWHATAGAAWPFGFMSEKEATHAASWQLDSAGEMPHNPATNMLMAYAIAISIGRLAKNHLLNRQAPSPLDYPAANLFADDGPLHAYEDGLSMPEQIVESSFFYTVSYLLPFSVDHQDALQEDIGNQFRRYCPPLYDLVQELLRILSPQLFDNANVAGNQTVSTFLLQVGLGVLAFGFDVSWLMDFVYMTAHPTLNKKISHQVDQSLVRIFTTEPKLQELQPLSAMLSEGFTRILTHLLTTLYTHKKVRVALLMGPEVSDNLDIRFFLNAQQFVQVVGDDYANCEVVVQSDALPLPKELNPQAQVFYWPHQASSRSMGQLYSMLYERQRQLNDAAVL